MNDPIEAAIPAASVPAPAPPDVILAPLAAVASGSPRDRLLAIKHKYAPVFGCERVAVGAAPDGGYLLLPDGTKPCKPHLNFPTLHPRHPESRYRWEDRPGGERWGWFADAEARDALG